MGFKRMALPGNFAEDTGVVCFPAIFCPGGVI